MKLRRCGDGAWITWPDSGGKYAEVITTSASPQSQPATDCGISGRGEGAAAGRLPLFFLEFFAPAAATAGGAGGSWGRLNTLAPNRRITALNTVASERDAIVGTPTCDSIQKPISAHTNAISRIESARSL